MATGGLSFPAVGTDGTGLRLLRALGHSLHEPYPALTPLTGKHPAAEQLAGVSFHVGPGCEFGCEFTLPMQPHEQLGTRHARHTGRGAEPLFHRTP